MERDHRNWDIKWTDSAVTIDILNKLQSHQKINHFPGMNTLSRKNNLAKNMSKMQAAFPELYTFIPKTFILPGDNAIFRSYHQEARRKGLDKTFIVKPEASCQGRGIFLSQSLTGTYVGIQEKSKAMDNASSRTTLTTLYSIKALSLTWESMLWSPAVIHSEYTSTTKDSSGLPHKSTSQ